MQTFRSKIDWWFWGVVIATTGLLLQFLWTMYVKGTMQEYPEHAVLYTMVAGFQYALYGDRTTFNDSFDVIQVADQ